MDLPKYAEIMNIERYALSKEKGEINESSGKFYIEEKVDGSQFRFGIDGTGNFMAGSKNVNYSSANQPDKSFKGICEEMEIKLKQLYKNGTFGFLKPNDFIVFYAEYLRSPKHNALKYDRVPKGNLYLFDIAVNGVYQRTDDIKNWARTFEIEPVNIYGISERLPEYNFISENLKMWKSCLGETNPEGVVIKNYDINVIDNFRKVETPLMIKIVRDEFKEILHKDWKQREGKGANDIIGRIMNQVNKNAVWDKAIFHLRDEGKLTGKMQDMKELVEKVDEDIEKEWKEVIYKELYDSFEYDIRRAFTKGLAEYYKKKLYDELKDKID